MRELDVMLLRYLEHVYPSAPAGEQAAFRHLLDLQDPEVYGLLLGRLAPETDALDRVLKSVRFKS